MKQLLRFLSREDAATAVEYAVMLALILLACIGSVTLVGQENKANFDENSAEIQKAFAHVK